MKIVRYLAVGGLAAMVDFSVFALAVKGLGLPWFQSAIGSFVLATLVNYLLSIRWIFRSGARFSRNGEVSLVFLVSLMGLAVNQAVLWLLINRLALDVLISKLLATASVFFWNYGVRRHFIFREVS